MGKWRLLHNLITQTRLAWVAACITSVTSSPSSLLWIIISHHFPSGCPDTSSSACSLAFDRAGKLLLEGRSISRSPCPRRSCRWYERITTSWAVAPMPDWIIISSKSSQACVLHHDKNFSLSRCLFLFFISRPNFYILRLCLNSCLCLLQQQT